LASQFEPESLAKHAKYAKGERLRLTRLSLILNWARFALLARKSVPDPRYR